MDEETIKNAGLIAAVICRVVDYHNVMHATLMRANAKKDVDAGMPSIENAERKVAVAIENVIDAGALK